MLFLQFSISILRVNMQIEHFYGFMEWLHAHRCSWSLHMKSFASHTHRERERGWEGGSHSQGDFLSLILLCDFLLLTRCSPFIFDIMRLLCNLYYNVLKSIFSMCPSIVSFLFVYVCCNAITNWAINFNS